jgi:hypothetical protein
LVFTIVNQLNLKGVIMAGISVRMVYMPYTSYMTIAGMQMVFDFSKDVSAGESILAYTVGLSFYQVRYATDSSDSSEEVGQMGVTMVPNLVGKMIYYTANLILTDFDGSGGAEQQDAGGGRNSYVWATCVAYIGTSLSDQTAVLCTAYDLTSSSSPNISISANEPLNYCFISGFDVYISPKGESQEPIEFSATANSNISGTDLTLSGDIELTSGGSSTGTMDIGLISTSGITNFAIATPAITWGDTDGQNGQTASISHEFTIPEGYNEIAYVGLLINNVTLSLGNAHHVQEVEFGLLSGGLTTTGSTVSGDIVINMWGDRDGHYYLDSGSMTVYLIVQFGSTSAG